MLIGFTMIPSFAGKLTLSSNDSSKLPAGTLVYYEDFNNVSGNNTDETVKALGWTLAEDFKKFTAILSIKDGQLHIDNLNATVGASNDSYAVVMSSDYLKNICNRDYTYQYDVTYRSAENTSRYLSMLCNYDGMNNYNTVDIRIRGDGYNQVRRGDSWIHYSDDEVMLGGTDENAMLKKLFNETFDDTKYAMADKTITVRVEMSMKDGPIVYVNGTKVSTMSKNTENWGAIDAYAFCFKSSTMLKADFDNLMLWTGIGCEPIIPSAETTAAAVATDTAAKPVAAAQTLDITLVSAVVALAASIGAALSIKKRK
jgi:hypothetical protein